MKNRYGNEYDFVAVGENTYKIVGELSYWRYGGREGQEGIDLDNLGFVDPSGGPFISIGYPIKGQKVNRIRAKGEEIFFDVDPI